MTRASATQLPRLLWAVHRPAAQGAEAQMIAEHDVGRDARRQRCHRARDKLGHRRLRGPSERLLRERNLDRAIPLDGQVGGWNMGEDRGELRLHRRLEAGHDQRPILAIRKHRAEGAVGQRQAHLKPESARDDTLIAQGAEDKIGVDRVARVAKAPSRIAEPDRGDAGLYLERPVVLPSARLPVLDAVDRGWDGAASRSLDGRGRPDSRA